MGECPEESSGFCYPRQPELWLPPDLGGQVGMHSTDAHEYPGKQMGWEDAGGQLLGVGGLEAQPSTTSRRLRKPPRKISGPEDVGSGVF